MIRNKLTKCLQAIHTRNSRRPFTPPEHWLVTFQIDMTTFTQATVLEKRNLLQPQGGRTLTKRQISLMSPRLGVLHSIPFETRVSIFRHFVMNDMMNRGRVRSTSRREFACTDSNHVCGPVGE